MPIYEYRCDDCGNVTEELVRRTSSDKSVEKNCAECKETKTHTRLVSGSASRNFFMRFRTLPINSDGL